MITLLKATNNTGAAGVTAPIQYKVKEQISIYKHLTKNYSYIDKKNVVIDTNEKLQGILGVSLPSEGLRVHFINWFENFAPVAARNDLKLNKVYNYLKGSNSCHNCTGCVNNCYNMPLYYQFQFKAIGDIRNLYYLIFETENFIKQCVKSFNNCRVVRLNVSGELNPIIWSVYKEIIRKCKFTKFYLYTKNYELLESVKNEIPKNLVINVSVWGNNTGVLKKYDFSKFNVYHTIHENMNITIDTTKKVRFVKCENGNCLECGKCFKNGNYIVTKIRLKTKKEI